MGTPVRDDAIRTIRCVAPATVSNDRAIGNVWRDRQLVDRLDETIVGSSVSILFGMRFSVARGWISDQQWFRRRVDGGKGSRSPDKGRADTTYSAGGDRLPRCGVAMNITRWTSGR
jgi:hypothetical protein